MNKWNQDFVTCGDTSCQRIGGKCMLRKAKNVKRVLCAVLACALTMMPVTPASAATARATTMKLEKTEGTVSLKTQNGSARKITNGMRLYNGNTLATGKHSYAYVSLDSSKAVKLDQSSTATLRQSGKNLELLVKDGKLFFNVSKPLADKESMNVRTSTMVTGIRGTCGVVEFVSAQTSKLYLLEGTVTLGSGENATTIQGGQTATVVLPPKQEAGGSDKPGIIEKPSIQVEKMTEETIPPVALKEIVNNKTLQKKIEKTTELKVEKIEKAFEQFQKEEAERIEQEKKEQEKDKEDKNKEDEKKEENKKEDQKTDNGSQNSSGSSDSGSSYVPGTPVTPDPPTTPEPPKEPTKTVLSGTAITFEQLRTALSDHDEVTLEGVVKLGVNDQLLIPAAKTLVVAGSIGGEGTISLGAGSILSNNGTIMAATIADEEKSKTNYIKNAGRIELSGKCSSAAEYSATDEAVLICNEFMGNAARPLLSVGDVIDNHSYLTTSIYAKTLNRSVSDYLYERSRTKRVDALFQQDAVISSDTLLRGTQSSEGQNSNLFLIANQHNIQVVSGTLTLEAVHLNLHENNEHPLIELKGGNLRIGGDGRTDIYNSTSGCAITVSGSSKIIVDTMEFSMYATEGVESMIQGMKANEAGKPLMPDAVSLAYGDFCLDSSLRYLSVQKAQEITLSGTVTQERIEEAFRYHRWVHIQNNADVQLEENATLVIPSGQTLQFWGTYNLPRTANIQVGDGNGQALLCVTKGSELTAGTIKVLEGGCLEDHGTLKCTELTGGANSELINNGELHVSGTMQLDSSAVYHNNGTMLGTDISCDEEANIHNSGVIQLAGAYTSASSKYYYSNDGVLISARESAGVPQDMLLVVARQLPDSTLATDTGAALAYYYASTMKTTVLTNMSQMCDRSVVWEFAKDAYLNNGDTVILKDFQANMGEHMLWINGTMTLSGACRISGSGSATVRLEECGQLVLGESGEDEQTATISNSGSGYAIESGYGGKLIWNNKRFRLVANGGFEKTLTGVSKTDSNIVQEPGYVTLAEGCSLEWNLNQNELRYVPSEFLNPSETVGAGTLNYVLQYNPVVTIGADVPGVLQENESVTIPSGKTLVIQSQMQGTETTGYQGGFAMEKGSSIMLKPGATLIVSGMIMGSGTICVGTYTSTETAKLTVAAGGSVVAETIELGGGSQMMNDGTIDVGGMTSAGGATVLNRSLIKLNRAYTLTTAAGADTYVGSEASALISNQESTAIRDWQLAYGYTQNMDGTASTILQYYYATSPNALVTQYMDQLREAHSDIQWEMKQDTSASTGI